jgi:hypothetical protein
MDYTYSNQKQSKTCLLLATSSPTINALEPFLFLRGLLRLGNILRKEFVAAIIISYVPKVLGRSKTRVPPQGDAVLGKGE